MRRIVATGLALALATTLAQTATAAENFYAGKTIKFIVGGGVGAGYDLQSRVLARHINKYIPGNPTMVVQNMPAGSGYAAPNHVYSIAEKDGTVMAMFNRAPLFGPLLQLDQAKYKVEEFNWIGAPASYRTNAYVFMIRSALPYKTFEELRTTKTPLNVGTANSIHVNVTKEALGANLKLIRGYESNELDMAFEKGEVDAQGTAFANLPAFKPEWLANNFVRIMVQYGAGQRLPELKDVPTARELARSPADRALVELSELGLTLGFPIAMPPGTPSDRVEIIRKAFNETMKDKDYQAELQQAKMEYSPKTAQELEADFASMGKIDEPTRLRYKKVVEGLGG
jgi:tripartite-type tricarboxylate transporter receptor subunit TctC